MEKNMSVSFFLYLSLDMQIFLYLSVFLSFCLLAL